MKKIIVIVAICLIVIACGVLAGLYMIGDKIIDETIDMSIPTVSTEATVVANGAIDEDKKTPAEQTAQVSQATTSVAADTTKAGKTSAVASGNTAKAKPPVVSVEKMNEIKDEVTAQEKVTVAAKVMSKLSPGEVSQLKGMLSGGLTAEEKEKAKSIAFANFSSKEIEEIKEMYRKYMDKK